MKATYVAPVRTPLDFDEACNCMRQGIHVATGSPPSDRALALCLSKTALETGRWKKMYCWNFGNQKASDNYEGMFTAYPCNEVIGGKVIWFDPAGQLDRKGGAVQGRVYTVPPGHPQTRFRAFANGYDGAQQYVDFIANGRYRDAWGCLLVGDVVGYVHNLALKGYFTADEASYLRGVDALFREFLPKVEDNSKAFRAELDTQPENDRPDTEPSGPPSQA